MAKVLEISVSADGREITFLTHGDSCLKELGDVEVVRASHVKFDNLERLWYVYLRHPDSEERIEPGFKSRAEAIEHEMVTCQSLLFLKPDEIDKMFEKAMEIDEAGRKTSG